MDHHIILASASPRRHQLLQDAGISFQVQAANTDEKFPGDLPVSDVAAFIATEKANTVLQNAPQNSIIIAADTVVICEGEILGKPTNEVHAISMLATLSDKTHQVITGVCVKTTDHEIIFSDVTEVSFNKLTAEQISYYVYTFKPYDKAGAYAIQEWIGLVGINRIVGDFYNVMGLPVNRVLQAIDSIKFATSG